MKSVVLRLYSGIFRCEDCDTEFSLFRSKSLICPECHGKLYEVQDDGPDVAGYHETPELKTT
jgi:Zn finger protein HypA/HybF involved in hydrogenase expression